jgi:NAD(P)-dependent dehydrogenase (short-subunit alcohol dehydrogenase family)
VAYSSSTPWPTNGVRVRPKTVSTCGSGYRLVTGVIGMAASALWEAISICAWRQVQLCCTTRANGMASESAPDVVVNSAGYAHFGVIEELIQDEVRAQLKTNLCSRLWNAWQRIEDCRSKTELLRRA